MQDSHKAILINNNWLSGVIMHAFLNIIHKLRYENINKLYTHKTTFKRQTVYDIYKPSDSNDIETIILKTISPDIIRTIMIEPIEAIMLKSTETAPFILTTLKNDLVVICKNLTSSKEIKIDTLITVSNDLIKLLGTISNIKEDIIKSSYLVKWFFRYQQLLKKLTMSSDP